MAVERREQRTSEYDRDGWRAQRVWHVENELNHRVALDDVDIPAFNAGHPDDASLKVRRFSFRTIESLHTLVTAHYDTRRPWGIAVHAGYEEEGDDIVPRIEEFWDMNVSSQFTNVDLNGDIIQDGEGCTFFTPHAVLRVEKTMRWDGDLTPLWGLMSKLNEGAFKGWDRGYWLCTAILPERLSTTMMKVSYVFELNPRVAPDPVAGAPALPADAHGWQHLWFFPTMADDGDEEGFRVPDLERGIQVSYIYKYADFSSIYTEV